MANRTEELRKRYSRVASGKDETYAKSRETGSRTKADKLRERYADSEYNSLYNEYNRRPTTYDSSALRFLNLYGNDRRNARRQELANQTRFMDAQRRAVTNGIDNGNNPLGLKNLENPLDNMRRMEKYKEVYGNTHKLSFNDAQKMEKAYGGADRGQLEKLKEHYETAKDRDYSGELEWVNDKLLSTATGEQNERRQAVLNKKIKDTDNRLARLYDIYAKKNLENQINNDDMFNDPTIKNNPLQSEEYQAKKEALENEKKAYQNELDAYEQNIDYRTSNDFEKYKEKGKQDTNNQVEFYRNNSDENIDAFWNNYDNTLSKTDNRTGITYTGTPIYERSDLDFVRAITEEEADNYAYILGKYGEEKAHDYLQSIAKHTDVNGAISNMQKAAEQGKKNPLLATAESIGLGLVTPFEAAKNITGFGGQYRTYDDYALAGRQEALRSGVNEAIQNTNLPGSENVLPFLYNTANSTADNLLRYAVGGGVGAASGSAGAAKGAMRLMMAGQVGDSAMKSALDRGLTDSQAVTTAIISAINEELFETISLERLDAMKAASPKQFRDIAKNVGKQILAEGSEEVFTDIGNAIADDLVNGEKSEIAQNIRNYMSQGLSEEEAKKKASVDFALQLVESGLAGGLSGATMGGVETVRQINTLNNQNMYDDIAQSYINAGMSEDDAYDAADNDVRAGLENKYDNEGNVVEQTGLKKSLRNAVKSAAELNENIQNLETQMKAGVEPTTPISDADIRDNKENIRLSKADNEYLNEVGKLLDYDFSTKENALKFIEAQDKLVEKYPERRQQITKTTSSVATQGQDKATALNDLRNELTNTMPINETSLESQINASQGNTANRQNIEVPQKAEFKATIDGEEKTIKAVNNGKIIVQDNNGREQAVDIREAELTDGASAAVEQAKRYGARGSRLYLDNLESGNIRNYTLAFNTFYNAGKNGKTFYGNKTLGVDTSLLIEAYAAGVADNSKKSEVGGLIRNEARYKIKEAEARVLDTMGKKFGVTIQIDNMISNDANGLYQDGIIHISANAENPALVVFSHEFTHRLEETSPEAYKEYENFVIDYLKEQGLYDSRAESLKNLYARAGVKLSEKDIRSEIAANATESFLTDADLIESVVNENKSLAQKIIDTIKSMINDLKDALSGYRNPKSTEAQAIRNGIGTFEKALELWINAAENQTESLIQKENEKSNSDAKYSMESTEGLEEHIKENLNSVLDMDSIATVTKNITYNKKDIDDYRKNLLNSFLDDKRVKEDYINESDEKLYKVIYKKRIGNIIIDEKSVKNLTQFNHMTSLGNMFNFNILDIISDGKIVYYEENRDGNNPDYAIIAAPVDINIDGFENNGKYLVGVAVKLTSKNRLYILRAEADFIRKKEAELLSSTPSFGEKTPSRDFASINNSASDINIILDNIIENNMQKKYGIETAKKVRELRNYKYKNAKIKSNEKNILNQKSNKELEVEYNAAVKAGNEEEAKKIVEQYAKNKGYNYKAFHGTNEPTFYVFDVDKANHATARFINGSFHSENEDVAKIFADVNTKLKGGKSRVIKTYLKMKKPLFLTGERFLQTGFDDKVKNEILNEIKEGKYDSIIVAPRNYQNNKYAKLGVEWAARGIIDPASNNSYKETKEYAAENGYTKEEADKIYSGITNPDFSHVQYAVFSPEQIKSADPVTYDDEGNVIPLSERFNKSNDDIRYSIKERNQFTKETGFDIATLENPTPEDITWYASRKENAINKYLENRNIKIEPVIKNKEIDNRVLDSDIIKKYIVDNDIDFVKLVSDSDLRDKFINYIQDELIDKAEKKFIKTINTKKLEAIKAAIEGDDYLDGYWKYNSDKLIEDLENIKNPKEEENKTETLEKKQKYVEEHYKDFEEYISEKIEKILGWNVSGEKEKATDEDIERHVEDAVNKFGTLKGDKKDWVLAGYITTNGDVLNFGSKGSDSRTHDHRDISAVYDDDESTKLRLFTPTDYLNQFLSEGNIRIMAESSSADFNSNNEPTTEQYNLIRDYIEDYAADTGKFIIEFSDDDGKSVDSKYYENNINSSQIINDIKRFYREGKIGGSNLNQFRFSLKEESNITRNDVAALTGKDPYMAEAVKDLEDIMRMKGGEAFFRANQKELYKIYDEIAEEYNIKDYSKKRFADNVKELFDYIQSVDNPDGVDTTMLAMQIADDMLDKGSIKDTSMEELYPTLQQQLRDYKIKIADQDKADLDGGYNAFRKKYFGSLTLSNDGTEVDSVYEDLASSYPELFSEDITHPGDRLTRIADVADMFRKTVDHIEGATRNESAFIIAQDIINKAVLEQTKNDKSIDNKKRLKAQEKVRKQNTNLKKAKKDIHDDYVKLQNKVKALESINERLDRKLTKAENELGRQKKEFADWAMGKKQVNKEDKYYKRKYDKLMQEFSKKKVAEMQKKYSAERRKNIEKIRKMVNELDRSVRRPDKNHYIPKYLVNSMLDVLRTIDLDSGYRKPDGSETLVYMKLKEMQKQYQEMKNDMDYAIASEYNETIDKAIGRLAEITKGRRLNELLDKDIADIVEIMEIITYQMRTARDLLENEKLSDIKEASQKAREQIKEAGRTFNTDAKLKNLFNRYLNNSLSPVRVMRRLEGYAHDGVLSSLGEELQQGERKTKSIRQKAYAMLDELYKDTKAIKALEKFRSEKLVYNIGGKNIVITPDMRAAIYLHSLNEQNMKHVVGNKTKEGSYRGGGIIIPNYQKQMKFNNRDSVKVNAAEKYTGQDAVRLSPSDVDRIIKDMTEYDKRIVELYQQVNEYLTKELNDTTMNLYGFKKATVKNYFPLIVDKSILNLDSDALKFDKTLESFGFLKERVNSAKPIYLEGVMDALERQIDQSSLFSGMAIPSRDFKKVWNYAAMDENDKFDNVNKQAQKAMGSYIDKYVGNLQADLAQARERGDASALLSAFGRGKMATGVLTGNLSVVLKQAASYPTAAGGVLGYRDLLAGLTPKGQRGKTLEKTMNKYTPLYQDRNTATITGVNINDMNLLKRRNPKLYYALTGWIESMDKATVRRLWYASENYVKRNFNYEVGSDDYYEEVAKVWEDTIRKTQPIYDTMNRPEYLRQTNELLKFLMMFKTQALQNVGIMVENYGELKARKRDYDKDKSDFNKKELVLAQRQFKKTVSSQIIQSLIFTGITALVDAFIKHRPQEWADEETGLITPESLRSSIIDAWTSNVIGQLAFGDIIRDLAYYPAKTLITGKEQNRFDLSVPPIEAMNTIINGINKGTNAVANNDIEKAKYYFKQVGETAAQYGFGLPVKNIENLYKGLEGNIRDIAAGKNPLEQSTDKQMYNRIYLAYQSGDPELAKELSEGYDEDKIKTKMVSKLKEEDTIKEVADYRYNSELDKYQAIVDAYVSLGFDEDWVTSAISSVMNKEHGTTGSGEYNSNDLQRAIDISAVKGSKVAQELYDEKYATYKADGLKDDEAKKKALSSVRSAITGKYKPQYEEGSTSQKVKIRDRLCSLRVAGERLYTYDSMKNWNK